VTQAAEAAREAWLDEPERGTVGAIRLLVWLALRLGRCGARVLLLPIVLYFVATGTRARAGSKRYLERVLGRPPSLAEVCRHFHTFATCVLDRVFFLNDRLDEFVVEVHGEEIMESLLAAGEGCFLFGGHFGSFEAVRAIGRQHPGVRVTLAMYEENARKIGAVIAAINPGLAVDVVALGRSGSMLLLKERLDHAHCVGVLADRGLDEKGQARVPFLGAEAGFPTGPFRMAELLKEPIVLMFGVFRGGRRYEIHFEKLLGEAELPGTVPAEEMMRRYVLRLEHHVRRAPFNWFNFYDFWR
jgi:predicted LPLAT superfamily acyltransferase